MGFRHVRWLLSLCLCLAAMPLARSAEGGTADAAVEAGEPDAGERKPEVSSEEVRHDIELAAQRFYYGCLGDGPPDFHDEVPDPRKMLPFAEQGLGDSLFDEYLKGYLIYDLLWQPDESVAHRALELFMEDPPSIEVEIPSRAGVRRSWTWNHDKGEWQQRMAIPERPPVAVGWFDTLRENVRDYTFQYHLESDAELQQWWAENKHKSRDQWARELVDRTLKEDVPLGEDQRKRLYMTTRHFSLLTPEGEEEFRQWWSEHRTQPMRLRRKELLRETIARLDAEDREVWERAWRQMASLLPRETMRAVQTPLLEEICGETEQKPPLRELSTAMRAAYEEWWEGRGRDFSQGPFSRRARALWWRMNVVEVRQPPPQMELPARGEAR